MVYITKEGIGVIRFIVNDSVKKVVIPKENQVPKQVFDLYHSQLSSFKNRHYAIARWIVKDIRRMGYVFKEKSGNSNIYVPIKGEVHIEKGVSKNISKEEKLRLLWLELDVICKKC